MRLSCRAVLFDLDGVLVESRASVERQWTRWADEHGVDMDRIRELMHGVRGAEVVAAVAPGLDAEAEAARIDHAQAVDLDGIFAMEGRRELVDAVPMWTVVTSGRHELASARLGPRGSRRRRRWCALKTSLRGSPIRRGISSRRRGWGCRPRSAW